MVAVVAGILAISKFYQQRWWLQILQRMSASPRSKLYLWYRVTRLEIKSILRREQTKKRRRIRQAFLNLQTIESNAVGRLTYFEGNVGLVTVEF
jgi:hypothetical protein